MVKLRLMVALVGFALLPLLASASAAQEEPALLIAADLGLPELIITVSDNGWDAPSEIPAGRYLITAAYEGSKDFGTAAFLRLPRGWSIDDLNAQLAQGAAAIADLPTDGTGIFDASGVLPPLEWLYTLTLAGGVSPVSGQTSQGIIDLFPGEWAIWGDDFHPLAIPLTVTGSMPPELAEPPVDIVITESQNGESFRFDIDGEFRGGKLILKIVNASSQPHFVEFVQLSIPVTTQQLAAFMIQAEGDPLDPGQVAPPGFEVWLSPWYAATQSAGTTQYVVIDVFPGAFAMMCWLPDPGHGFRAHAEAGMIEVFEVSDEP